MIIATKKKKKETSKEQDKNNTWVKATEDTKKIKEVWSDGYDFGDVTKTILGVSKIAKDTTKDALVNIGKGFMSTVEGSVDSIRYGMSDIYRKLAEKNPDQTIMTGGIVLGKPQQISDKLKENAQYEVTKNLLGEENDIFKENWSAKVDEKSVLGNKSDSIFQGVGNVGAFVGMSQLTGGSNLSTFLNSFSSAYGNARTEAYKQGADDKTANRAGWVSGLAEGISEQFFSGIPGMKTAGWGDALNSRLSKAIQKYLGSTAGKVALTFFDGLGEGSEEVISNMLNATFTDIMHYLDENYTYGMDDMSGNIPEDVFNSAFSQDSLDSFISGMFTSLLTGGGKQVIQSQSNARTSNKVAKQSDMSKSQANEIMEKIAERRANLTLEEDANYKERTEAIESARQQLNKEIRQEIKQGNTVDLNELFNQTPADNTQAQFTFNNDEIKNVRTDKQNVLANDMAKLNNVKSNHDLYKTINAIQSANNTQQYHITTTEGLYKMGLVDKTADGKYVMKDGSPYVPRGLNYKDGDIYINADVGSQSGTQAVYHEMFESFKKASPNEYKQFKQMVKDIVGEESIQESIQEYTKMYGEELTDNIEDEIINDKFGELAESQDFINRISDNRTLLQKFIDTVKNMINYVKGTEEERKLIKLQKELEKQFAKRYKATDFSQNKGETAYSLDKIQGLEDYTRDEVKNIARDYINNTLLDSGIDAEIEGLEIIGSRNRGNARTDSDLDVVVELKGDNLREDDLFSTLNDVEDRLSIEGIDVDINPILSYESGTIQDYLKRSNQYDQEVMNKTKYSLSPTGEMVDSKGNKVTLEASEVETNIPIRDDAKLMAIHNLGEDKLNGVLDLGGFPVPSIAITDPSKVNHSQFGNISILFNKSTIDPSYRRNEVYDRDVWTPTFPRVEYDLNMENIRKMSKENKIYDNYDDDIVSHVRTNYFYGDNLSDLVDRNGIDGALERMKQDKELKYLYQKTLDNDYQPQMKPTKYNNEFDNSTLQEYVDLYNSNKFNDMSLPDFYYHYLNYGDMDLTEDQTKALKATIRDIIYKEYRKEAQEEYNKAIQRDASSVKQSEDAFIDNYVNMMLESYDKSYFKYKDFIKDASRLDEFGETMSVDQDATLNKVNEEVNQEDFNNWIDNTFGKLLKEAKKGIRNDKDIFTASGNRRSFNQLHEEYNLRNIVDYITSKNTVAGEEGFGSGQNFGTFQAKLSNRFNSIEDIKNAQDRLQFNEETKELLDNYSSQVYEYMNELGDYSYNKNRDYYYGDNAGYALNDFAGYKNHNEANLNKALENNGIDSKAVPQELKNNIIKTTNELKNIPTDYFEAKPQRAVGLDEIQMAVIPNTASQELKQRLQDYGIKYTEYDPSIEGDRNRVVNQFSDLKFSMTSNENIEAKDAPITQQELAPIKQDLSKITEQMNNLSNQIETLQNGLETTPSEEIAPVNPYRERAVAQKEANQAIDEIQKDDNYWQSLEQIANEEGMSALDDKSARKLSRNIGKELGLKQKQVKDLQNVINDAFNNGYSLDQIKEELYSRFGHDSVVMRNEEAIDAQKQIREYRIKVSPEIQKNITDYGYWKQQYFGKIKFSKDGDSVDSVYGQLNEQNPAMFPSDIWNETDQLLRIAEVADMDKKFSMDYEMDQATIDEAANYIHDTFNETLYANAIKSANDLEQSALQYNDRTKDIPIKKRTRQEVRDFLQSGMGITTEDLQAGNDIKSMQYQLTTPERVNEKVFGREVGRKINEQTVNFAKHQEAERTRFLNKERNEIKDLGIKARSKESALVQQYGEGLLDDVQLAQQVENVETQNKIKNAARVLRGKYDAYLDQINEVLTDMGYDPIPKRKDYMRHFQELTDKFSQAGIPFNRQDLNAENLPTDINGLTEFNTPGKNYFASAKQRKGFKTTYDAITGIDGYLEGASNLMYHTETIQRYRTLEKMIRDTYGQTHGLDEFNGDVSSEEAMQRVQDIENGKLSNYAAWIHEQGNAIAGKKGALDRGFERALGRRAYTLANTLKKQTGSNMTGFNVRSALTNFISSTIAAAKTNKMAMVHGTIDTIKNIFHDDGFINRSDFLTSRFGSDSLSQKTWQKISNAGQIFMQGSDWFTSNLITRSKYYEGLSKGMTDTQAMNYANDFAARVMGDRSKGATAEAFNSKTLGFLTQFQLETNNQWQYMIHDTKMEFQENLAKNGGLKASSTVLFQMGQLAAYSYLFNEMFEKLTGSRAAFDIADILKKLFGLDPDDEDKTFEERMKEAGSELVDALPFASLFGSGGRLPIGEMLTPFQTVYDYITGGTNKYGDEIKLKDVTKDLKETLPYYLLPTGYGQLKKTIQGLGMYNDENPIPGSYTDSGNLRFTADTDTGSIIKNALFGQWSGEEAKKYRESGYKTINAKDIPVMKDLGMSSSEFREFKTEMKEETTTTMDHEGVTYNLYFDKNGNRYWYDKSSRTVYDDKLNPTDLNVLSLEKANANELKYDYVSNLNIDEDTKQKLFDELFSNTTTDKYGYKKYTDESNKTYWYDEDNDTLYNSKYSKVSKDSVKGLKEVTESKNMDNYKDYGSYAEFDYAYKNPGKYKTIKAIAGYDNYKKFDAELKTIRDNTKQDKKETIKYVNSLDLTIPQKAMFIKQYYPTFNDYNKEIVNYVSGLDVPYEDKVEILKSLKFKVDSNGNVKW